MTCFERWQLFFSGLQAVGALAVAWIAWLALVFTKKQLGHQEKNLDLETSRENRDLLDRLSAAMHPNMKDPSAHYQIKLAEEALVDKIPFAIVLRALRKNTRVSAMTKAIVDDWEAKKRKELDEKSK